MTNSIHNEITIKCRELGIIEEFENVFLVSSLIEHQWDHLLNDNKGIFILELHVESKKNSHDNSRIIVTDPVNIIKLNKVTDTVVYDIGTIFN